MEKLRNRRGPKPRGETSTREAILNVAYRCFALHGYHKTTTRLIAGEAGVDAALIAYQFGSKEKLWLAVIEALAARQAVFIRQADALHSADLEPAAALRRLFELLIMVAQELPEFQMMISHEMLGDGERFRILKTHIIDPFIGSAAPVILRAMEAGHFPSGNSEMIVYFLLSGASQTMLTWTSRDGLDIEVGKFLNGIITD